MGALIGIALLGAMFDRRASDPHVVPVRPDFGAAVVASADTTVPTRGTAFVVTFDDPQPPRAPNVVWSVDGDAARVESPLPASDGATYVDPASGGATVLRASIGPPVNEEVDAPIFVYRSFLLGCASRRMPLGIAFAADGSPSRVDSGSLGEIYARGIACGTPMHAPLAIVTASGFTFAPTRTVAEFAAVSAHAWKPGGAKAVGFATFGTLLARLRDGRTVKFFVAYGGHAFVDAPYAIALRGGEFADVTFARTDARSTVKRLPDAVRIPGPTPEPEAWDGSLALVREAR